jgi:hypothetical protein
MTTEELRKAHIARPFRPFYLRLGDGQRLPIRHPEMLAYTPKSRVAAVYLKNDSYEIVELLLVTGLEFAPARRRTNQPR